MTDDELTAEMKRAVALRDYAILAGWQNAATVHDQTVKSLSQEIGRRARLPKQ